MNEQHKDMYFQSGKTGKSYLTIEWYNQHGCGFKDSEDTNGIDCHTGKSTTCGAEEGRYWRFYLVLQYKCDAGLDPFGQKMQNGFSIYRPHYSGPPGNINNERKSPGFLNL